MSTFLPFCNLVYQLQPADDIVAFVILVLRCHNSIANSFLKKLQILGRHCLFVFKQCCLATRWHHHFIYFLLDVAFETTKYIFQYRFIALLASLRKEVVADIDEKSKAGQKVHGVKVFSPGMRDTSQNPFIAWPRHVTLRSLSFISAYPTSTQPVAYTVLVLPWRRLHSRHSCPTSSILFFCCYGVTQMTRFVPLTQELPVVEHLIHCGSPLSPIGTLQD